jgi:acetyl esterase/lipase
MNPRTNDDKLFAWAGKTGLPILSIDYRKAPEYPYPYALHEALDVYKTIVASRGRCIGLSGGFVPRIVVTGDSAGGNLAAGLMIMIIEYNLKNPSAVLPVPEGLVLVYPNLSLNMKNWMTDEEMALIRDKKMRKTNRDILRRKSMQYTNLAKTPHQSDDEAEGEGSTPPLTTSNVPQPFLAPTAPIPRRPTQISTGSAGPQPIRTRLAMSSMISYFNDRVLTPELMRSMVLLYIGPNARPDFSTDYLLSPILAPDEILEAFPKTYFLTGERDPLVDDTVLLAGRLRKVKGRSGITDAVEVVLVPGISHGFMSFVGVYPEGWGHIYRCARWIEEAFALPPKPTEPQSPELSTGAELSTGPEPFHFRRGTFESSGDEDHLEINMSQIRNRASPPPPKSKDKERELRRRKEKLLHEELGPGRKRKKARPGMGERKKSMVSLASEDDLLGRRMLGLAMPLTGIGND